ncbi:tRNA (adenosine(37)-N6)-dimethylallyltransferase MiaA [Actibacterium sp. MT2.3-13A]|uniref:tRNA (adenosine(37)-N6)-dimethylallyltransferase MiaA n=1 Tax=Actibacterium sp. MT2.3-13A TaxID=2828332 RepID=UPI001BA76E0C|nr:tRNA (adenosine(37)-N6)-dimethylallyltransferase MiaA [Actibacterium sp. MT2.3-13A]
MDITTLDPARPVLIAGPTASGKSGLALRIAEEQGGVIVNADALQVFANWRVLTARPSKADEARAPHALYGHVPWDGDYSVGHWLREVAPLLRVGARPIIVGGTGLYFTALTEGLAEIPATPPEIRAEADRRRAAEGHAALLAELDAQTRARVDTLNPMRVQRAWEVLRATGRGLAAWQDDTGPALLPLDRAQALVLEAGRDWLAERIDRRFDMMLAEGALEEARANLAHWDPALLSMKAIGAPELIAHLKGEMTLEEARAAAQAASRQYAKRQRTWFRSKMRAWRWIAAG